MPAQALLDGPVAGMSFGHDEHGGDIGVHQSHRLPEPLSLRPGPENDDRVRMGGSVGWRRE